jgi:hypothetical protein
VLFGYEANAKDSQIEFLIQDSGIGIDEMHHKKIFDRFHRVENDYTIKAGGLGLGLAISKAYVQMLGGTISFESGESKGTTFSFTIPLQYASSKDSAHCSFTKPQIEQKTIEILVAEDDNINFLLIQKMLHLNKHRIIRAKDGKPST